ncbi:MAG: hypothetical protein JWP75_1855, partial [Frondihabitans sp.]|nr:hypothetical protein [Frondihabitans sp.]
MRLEGFIEIDGVPLLCTDDGPVDADNT